MRQVADSRYGRAVYPLLSPLTGGEKRGEGSVRPCTEVVSCRSAEGALERFTGLSISGGDWRREILREGMPRFAVVLHDTDTPQLITRSIVGLPVSAFIRGEQQHVLTLLFL